MNAPSLALLAVAALLAAGGAAAAVSWRAWRALGREGAAFAERLGELASRLPSREPGPG